MLALDKIEIVTKAFKDGKTQDRLKHNNTLFNVYEGDLLSYVLDDLRRQLSPKSYEQAKHRVAPINVLKRIIDKLSKIYAKPPTRTVEVSGTKSEKDIEILTELYHAVDANTVMNLGNEFFNLHKYLWIEPFLDQGNPQLRVLPADRFLVFSEDPVNPLRPTIFSKLMGQKTDALGQARQIFYTYTETDFAVHDDSNQIDHALMAAIGNAEGVNPLGKLPGVYVNRSRHELIPQVDSDTLAMSKLIAVILSDLNYAVMFQCFCIIYGINITQEGLEMAPNAFWNIKTDASSDGNNTKIDVLKPSVDSQKVLELVKAELGLWMQSRNIKPGIVGDLGVEGAKSGIAKIVDEMDTSEDRQKQVPFFMQAETDLFEVITVFHSVIWIKEPDYKLSRTPFSENSVLKAMFAEQKPQVDTSQVITDQINLRNNRLSTTKRALQAIYPDMNDDTIDAMIDELHAEFGKDLVPPVAKPGVLTSLQETNVVPAPSEGTPSQAAPGANSDTQSLDGGGGAS